MLLFIVNKLFFLSGVAEKRCQRMANGNKMDIDTFHGMFFVCLFVYASFSSEPSKFASTSTFKSSLFVLVLCVVSLI